MIIFLYGENDFRISQKLNEIKNKFIKDVDQNGQNIFQFDGEKIKLEDLSAQIGTSSLFSSKKMVIISNLIKNKQKDFSKRFLEYIKKNHLSESSEILVFVEKSIRSKGEKGLLKKVGNRENPLTIAEKTLFNFLKEEKYSQELKNYTNLELANFIKKEFDNYSLKIDNPSTQLLINLTAGDLWTIFNEIKKISNLKLSNKENKIITKSEIEQNVSAKFQENIFAFTDAISSKNSKTALDILEEQYLSGLEAEYILSMMIRQFKILLQIREALDLNYGTQKMVSNLKLHPFIISKGINQAKNFSKEFLIKIINNLIDLEHQSRKSDPNLKASLNLLIINI
ncbi:DNA polymerase III subunit delta [Candidatus Falkowbacteria bacterium HGW-Falkowbacteria-1]|jgi:DNA polymerase-3 subunit delta|uniref:DNA polymerase III subunit delta n=1 Tax=Candidatus Falkowbacteria bacterium HGW-Falkowbacteria-1 TaxID=2013768 RepID=A0A2N2E8M7_9BACT|nr:MAG: DNA polymerase III subunit delta [Candidatus Falkowbacteria bacterium HGW-Falkowbacteria-1]